MYEDVKVHVHYYIVYTCLKKYYVHTIIHTTSLVLQHYTIYRISFRRVGEWGIHPALLESWPSLWNLFPNMYTTITLHITHLKSVKFKLCLNKMKPPPL